MEGRRALWFPCGGVRGSLGVQGGARRRLAVRRGSGRQPWAVTPTAGRDGVNKGFRGGDKRKAAQLRPGAAQRVQLAEGKAGKSCERAS